MGARRITLRSSKEKIEDEMEEGFEGKSSVATKGKYRQALYCIIAISISLAMYHCHEAYVEQLEEEQTEREQAMNCMYQFKTEDCNPLNMTDKCSQIYSCIEKSPKDINELEIFGETIKRASKNLNETVMGPAALIGLAILIVYIKDKA